MTNSTVSQEIINFGDIIPSLITPLSCYSPLLYINHPFGSNSYRKIVAVLIGMSLLPDQMEIPIESRNCAQLYK